MVKVYKSLQEALGDIKAGKIGVIPTDTLYGVVGVATDIEAAAKVLDVKGRKHKPGTIIAASIDQLVELGLKRRYLTAVEQYWPGAISIVIPTGPTLDYLHQGKFSLAVRIPDDKQLVGFLEETGPLVTSSANHTGKKPAANIKEARDDFSDDMDFYVDGGDLSDAKPSTIIRVVDDAVEILREGSVNIDPETGRIIK